MAAKLKYDSLQTKEWLRRVYFLIMDALTHGTVKGGGASRSNTELRLQTEGTT